MKISTVFTSKTVGPRIFLKLGTLSAVHLQNSLFLRPRDQQMAEEIELKAFNQIATVTEIQLIEWWIDGHST